MAGSNPVTRLTAVKTAGEIQHCSFCGGPAQMWHQRKHGRGVTYVQCDDSLCCTTKHGVGQTEQDREASALASWNTRNEAARLRAALIELSREVQVGPGLTRAVYGHDAQRNAADTLKLHDTITSPSADIVKG